jgi:hypothetical protein
LARQQRQGVGGYGALGRLEDERKEHFPVDALFLLVFQLHFPFSLRTQLHEGNVLVATLRA